MMGPEAIGVRVPEGVDAGVDENEMDGVDDPLPVLVGVALDEAVPDGVVVAGGVPDGDAELVKLDDLVSEADAVPDPVTPNVGSGVGGISDVVDDGDADPVCVPVKDEDGVMLGDGV